MSNVINWLLIGSVLLVIIGTILLATLLPRTKSGPQQACLPNEALVDGVCKTVQNGPCIDSGDCLQNLKCQDNVCTNNTPPPAVIEPPLVQPEVIKAFKTININEIVPRSVEINSNGHEERGFMVYSADTPVAVVNQDISTPYQENNGYLIPKGNREENGVKILDACSYSQGTVFLLANGKVIFQYPVNGKIKRRLISLNVKLTAVVNFGGYIYGLYHKNLYYCDNSDPDLDHWNFTLVPWTNLPNDITYIGATYDSKSLVVQNATNGFVFNTKGDITHAYNAVNTIRIYGKDTFMYAELNTKTNTAVIYPSGRKYTGVSDIAFDYHGDIITVPTELRNQYQRIAMVDWKPFFI